MVREVVKILPSERARHEAGHAIVGAHFGWPISSVTIEPTWTADGRIVDVGCCRFPGAGRHPAAEHLRVDLAAKLAMNAGGQVDCDGAWGDGSCDGTDIGRRLSECDGDQRANIVRAVRDTLHILTQHKTILDELTGALLTKRTLGDDELNGLLRGVRRKGNDGICVLTLRSRPKQRARAGDMLLIVTRPRR